jgi:hypothetical protein
VRTPSVLFTLSKTNNNSIDYILSNVKFLRHFYAHRHEHNVSHSDDLHESNATYKIMECL